MITDIATLLMYALFFITLYFEVFLLITFFEHSEKKQRHHAKVREQAGARTPSVTIAVPCFNEERTLARTIESLLAIDYPKDKLEVVIVNDGSTDNTAAVADGFEGHEQVRVFHKENGGKHTALNLAIEKSQADVIGALDADSFADKESLKRLTARFIDPEVQAVTGAIKVHEPKGMLQGMQKEEYILGIFFRWAYTLLRAQYVTPGPLSLYRRSALNNMGPFRAAHNTEDMEMAMRMQAAGYHIENVPDAYVYTRVPRTLRALMRQRVRWLYGFIKNAMDYKHLFFNKKYGNLGFLVLPSIVVSVFGAIYAFTYGLVRVADAATNKAAQIQAIGVESSFGIPSFDFFFMSANVGIFLTISLFILTAALLVIGKRLAKEQSYISPSVLYYLVLFGFLAPIWVTKATFDALRSKKSSWTEEKIKANGGELISN